VRRAPAGTALVLRALRLAEPPGQVRRRRLLAEARKGVRVVTRDRLLRALAGSQLLAALAAGATSALLVLARRGAPIRSAQSPRDPCRRGRGRGRTRPDPAAAPDPRPASAAVRLWPVRTAWADRPRAGLGADASPRCHSARGERGRDLHRRDPLSPAASATRRADPAPRVRADGPALAAQSRSGVALADTVGLRAFYYLGSVLLARRRSSQCRGDTTEGPRQRPSAHASGARPAPQRKKGTP
jgi:hypothetical protein